MVEALSYFSQGFLLGLATGHLCLATCGPIYAPYLVQTGKNAKSGFRIIMEISIGRFISYALFGAVAGFLGLKISGINRQWFTSAAYILFSIYLLVTVFRTHNSEKSCSVKKWSKFTQWPVLLGVLTGINFCPSFLIVLTRAIDLSGPLAGLLLFVAFFVGTSIFLIPFSFLGYFGKKKLFRNVARISSIIIAIWFIGNAGISIYKTIQQNNRPVITIMDEKPLYVISENDATIKKFVRTIALHRTGAVYTVSSVEKLPEKCYVFLERSWLKKRHLSKEAVRKAGRFVIILPLDISPKHAEYTANRISEYLTKYYFFSNPLKGSLYVLPKELMKYNPLQVKQL